MDDVGQSASEPGDRPAPRGAPDVPSDLSGRDRPFRYQPVVDAPFAEQPVADLTALLAVWAAILVGGLFVLFVPTPADSLDVFLVIVTTAPLWATAGYGLIVFVRVFRQGSVVRAALTVVPRRFHLLAYGWAIAVVVPTLAVPRVAFGDFPDEWYPQSALELWLNRSVPAGVVIALGLACSVTLAVNAHIHSRRASQRPEPAGCPT